MIRWAWALLFASVLLCLVVACGAASPAAIALRSYHEPSFGWTARVPADWVSCDVTGGRFTRGLPTIDPTKLFLWTYFRHSKELVLDQLATEGGVTAATAIGEWSSPVLRWTRYRGGVRDDSRLAVEFALASEGADAHLILLLADQHEIDALVETVLRPTVESFVSGPSDPPRSVLSISPPEPDYWPTAEFGIASPSSQGMDSARLEALVALVRDQAVPIDSVTIVRHGFIVLDEYFPPYRSSELHDLHSATKSITAMLVGIALAEQQRAWPKAPTVQTPVLELLAPRTAAHLEPRKRALKLVHLLTMTAGFEWKEWDAAYEPGTGNDLVRMVETSHDWTQFVLDRPMADDPGTIFSYNSGASYLLSSILSQMEGMPASRFAEQRVFAPLGITEFEWASGPEGVTAGWGNLRLKAKDLARLGLLALHKGKWDGQAIVPEEWMLAATTDQVADPTYDYGYQWWLDIADGYAFMSGRYGQTVIVAPRQDMVIVITAHLPDTVAAATAVPRWLAEKYILPAAR